MSMPTTSAPHATTHPLNETRYTLGHQGVQQQLCHPAWSQAWWLLQQSFSASSHSTKHAKGKHVQAKNRDPCRITSHKGHHIITSHKGHHIITSHKGHHIITTHKGHHIITSHKGHHIITTHKGHHIITTHKGHHIISTHKGHHIITSHKGHHIITSHRGHHIITSHRGHHIITSHRGHHTQMGSSPTPLAPLGHQSHKQTSAGTLYGSQDKSCFLTPYIIVYSHHTS